METVVKSPDALELRVTYRWPSGWRALELLTPRLITWACHKMDVSPYGWISPPPSSLVPGFQVFMLTETGAPIGRAILIRMFLEPVQGSLIDVAYHPHMAEVYGDGDTQRIEELVSYLYEQRARVRETRKRLPGIAEIPAAPSAWKFFDMQRSMYGYNRGPEVYGGNGKKGGKSKGKMTTGRPCWRLGDFVSAFTDGDASAVYSLAGSVDRGGSNSGRVADECANALDRGLDNEAAKRGVSRSEVTDAFRNYVQHGRAPGEVAGVHVDVRSARPSEHLRPGDDDLNAPI